MHALNGVDEYYLNGGHALLRNFEECHWASTTTPMTWNHTFQTRMRYLRMEQYYGGQVASKFRAPDGASIEHGQNQVRRSYGSSDRYLGLFVFLQC